MRPGPPRASEVPVTDRTKCQKCLEPGHWTADCKNPPAYKRRPSRSALLRNPAAVKPEQAAEEKLRREQEQLEMERQRVLSSVLGAGREEDEGPMTESDFSDQADTN